MRVYLVVILFSVYACQPSVEYPLKGFSYPISPSGVDTANYIFQLRDSLSTKDSFNFTQYYRIIFQAFDEPNLSIRPQQRPVYRLVYGAVMGRTMVVTLTENQIVVKEQTKGYSSPYYDTARLSLLEKKHFLILKEHFPLQEVEEGWRRKYLDSLANFYPKLLDVNYYQALRNKAMTFGEEGFAYKTETIPISKSTYARLVNGINSSDFWEQPYYIDCDNPPNDGFGFSLEVNTPNRYKNVFTSFCPGYSRSFHIAWQELINCIKRDKKLTLMWRNY